MKRVHHKIWWILLIMFSFLVSGCTHTAIKVTLEKNGRYIVETNVTTFGCVSHNKGTETILQCSTYIESEQ